MKSTIRYFTINRLPASADFFLPDFLFNNFSRFLDFHDALERIFRDEKKRTAVEIQVKEIRALYEVAERFPGP